MDLSINKIPMLLPVTLSKDTKEIGIHLSFKKSLLKELKGLSLDVRQIINDYELAQRSSDINLEYCHNIYYNNEYVGMVELANAGKNSLALKQIYIQPEFRNKGILTNIIHRTLKNYERILISIFKDDKLSLDIFKKLGFVMYSSDKYKYKLILTRNKGGEN